ncbi:MAG: NADH-quinone oxidoreductase subunit H, partial [Candidatus Thermoplasmatota archaeon]|nr:NADH-quinone oxidoreductase subunit H [Candidatus Thermoplasmatota archaeon]
MSINDLPVRFFLGIMVILGALYFGLVLKGIDRKLAARMQSRIGPPIRQPFWDVSKLFQKENIIPRDALDWLFNGMPIVALVGALAIMLYLPIGPLAPVFKGYGDLVLVIYLFAIPGLAMALGGFASGSPVAAIGSQREMAMMMSYELPLAIIVATLAWITSGMGFAGFEAMTYSYTPIWSLVGPVGIIGALLLMLSLLIVTPGELSKIPFDQPEAETELAGGILAEYSGRNLALFYLADAVKTLALGTLVVALFIPWNLSPMMAEYVSLPTFQGMAIGEWLVDGLFFI